MQATKQQQILGYFIEEAKEHLDTIERGLLDLQATMADTERLNELFRAAHSVKGGAAMLGFTSIHKVGHHLEDCFKLLTDHPVKIDQSLENLFLQGFDILKELVEELQSPYGLKEEDAAQRVQAAEPTFAELQNYLNRLLQEERNAGKPAIAVVQPVPANPELANRLHGALKMMLQLFKQGDTPANRQQLATLCSRMVQLNSSAEWRRLLQAVHSALAHPRNTYAIMAPLVIKELKLAGDLLLVGRASEIIPSTALQQLTIHPAPTPQLVAKLPLPEATHQPAVREVTTAKANQIIIPAEPRAAARALLEAFNKSQLIELAEFLMKAIQ
ncbi:Hpt domain-containing protein [Stenomitos frigidus]|uniref:Histidine kinase n=1 Tax=Stenomitos frigidus ULC18 TaxID=2107698 RepID=A0A2T1EGQ8_9CYAN|nr:Hpt domain-containing protein [Stenomitos frigidus]PSB31919.1 histidine kinase [Stenomitos frigidus ULC18]